MLPTVWQETRKWVVNRPQNNVWVLVTSMDNGRPERIWYTGIEEKAPGAEEFEHVKNSSQGHGYGLAGKLSAEARIERLLAGDWARFTRNQPQDPPKPPTAWDRINDG